jgi:hypothetical protein
MATETSKAAITKEQRTDMPIALFTHPRAWLASSLVAAALLVAACGGGSSTSSSSSSASAPASTTTSKTSSSSPSASGASGIPQGANAGDKDADNQGGPTDGDGNL